MPLSALSKAMIDAAPYKWACLASARALLAHLCVFDIEVQGRSLSKIPGVRKLCQPGIATIIISEVLIIIPAMLCAICS